MKSLLFLSACGLILAGVSACAPTAPPGARVALDCPSDQGDLKLSNMSPDRKTCLYTSRDGDQVSLRLISVSGSYEAALQPIEAELQGEVETDQQKAADAKAVSVTADGNGVTASAKATAAASSDAAKAARQAANDALGQTRQAQKDEDDDKVNIEASDGNGDHTSINLPGIHISADDDKANVRVAGINVNAGDNGATVRMSRDVRLRGEALSPERRGFRSTYILARDDLKDGWKAVGYEAGGPKTGPITVAVFKARQGDHEVSEEVKRLVRRNGGV